MAAWPKWGAWHGARLREAVPEEHTHPAIQLQLLLQAPPRLILRQRRARLIAEHLRAQQQGLNLGSRVPVRLRPWLTKAELALKSLCGCREETGWRPNLECRCGPSARLAAQQHQQLRAQDNALQRAGAAGAAAQLVKLALVALGVGFVAVHDREAVVPHAPQHARHVAHALNLPEAPAATGACVKKGLHIVDRP